MAASGPASAPAGVGVATQGATTREAGGVSTQAAAGTQAAGTQGASAQAVVGGVGRGERVGSGAPPKSERVIPISHDGTYYIDVYYWFKHFRSENVLSGALTLVLVLVLGFLIGRIFRGHLAKNRLEWPLRLATWSVAVYAGLWAMKARKLMDPYDVLSIVIHKLFVVVMLYVGLRLVDRLLIVPLMTRGGKVTLSRFVHQIVTGVLALFVGLGYASWAFGLDITSFLAGSAVISIVLGLALQETLGNFFSGMVIQASVPFHPGHWIRIGDVEGRVVEMTWRAVTLHTRDDNYVLIPNALIAKEQIVNFSIPTKATARHVMIGLEYELSPNEAKRVLLRAAVETEGVLAEPEPRVMLENYGDSAIVYRVKFWIADPERHEELENAVRVNAWYRLKQAGCAIPFQVSTVELVNLDKKIARERREAEAARAAAVGRVPLFAMLSEGQREQLAREARDLELCAGQRLYAQGEEGDSFFVLLKGTVDVYMKAADGKDYDIGDITAGSFFGELSATTGAPRPTTIKAQTDIQAIEITRETLQRLFEQDPSLMTHISEVVAQRQAEREKKLQELGARHVEAAENKQATDVLSRMKKLFGGLGVGRGFVF